MTLNYSNDVVQWVADYVLQEMEWLCSAHDFFHIERVVSVAQKIHDKEWQWNIMIIELGALLHEFFDEKMFEKDSHDKRRVSLKLLLEWFWLSVADIDAVFFIIDNVWYGKSLTRSPDFVGSIEFMIVEDADRIDAIWAIAIARAFAYWWRKGQSIYDPSISCIDTTLDWSYRKIKSTSINHFYEKLLLLKDLMHTSTGFSLAEERHEFMVNYLTQFMKERSCDA